MKKILILIFSLVILLTFLSPQNVLADTQEASNCKSADGNIALCNPLTVNTPQELIGRIINAVLGIVGSLALLMFVYGGLTWMTSSGSQEKVKKGRDIIVWSAIGLAIIFASYGLVRILLTAVK